MKSEIREKVQEMMNRGVNQVNLIYSDGSKVKKRLGKTSDGYILVMKTRKRGNYLSDFDCIDVEEIKIVPEKIRWEKSVKKAISIVKESGLWSKLLREWELAVDIGYEKLQELRKIDRSNYPSADYQELCKIRTEKIKEVEPRLIKVNEEGKEYYEHEIIWNWSYPLKIKKMYFGKYGNEEKLRQISEALKKKEKFYISGRASYDVSFNYDGGELAWYSEEYRNCGNGHYYLALSNKYAVYYEDD